MAQPCLNARRAHPLDVFGDQAATVQRPASGLSKAIWKVATRRPTSPIGRDRHVLRGSCNLVRLPVGIEKVEDLAADLLGALEVA